MVLRIQPNGGQTNGNQAAGGVVSLAKGQRVSLTKQMPSLDKVHVGLGWDVNERVGQAYDLDVSVFLLGANGKCPTANHFIFYNNLSSPDGSVRHTGDNLTGDGDGDDESVKIQLSAIPADVDKVVFTVTIHDAAIRNQSFGQVENAFIRIVDEATGAEVIRYDLAEDFSIETSMVVAELYRKDGEWRFNAVGQGYQTDLGNFCGMYGINIG